MHRSGRRLAGTRILALPKQQVHSAHWSERFFSVFKKIPLQFLSLSSSLNFRPIASESAPPRCGTAHTQPACANCKGKARSCWRYFSLYRIIGAWTACIVKIILDGPGDQETDRAHPLGCRRAEAREKGSARMYCTDWHMCVSQTGDPIHPTDQAPSWTEGYMRVSEVKLFYTLLWHVNSCDSWNIRANSKLASFVKISRQFRRGKNFQAVIKRQFMKSKKICFHQFRSRARYFLNQVEHGVFLKFFLCNCTSFFLKKKPAIYFCWANFSTVFVLPGQTHPKLL